MNTTTQESLSGEDAATPVTDEQVRLQLQSLVQSVHFRNSRRYPALLGYIVEQTLAHNTAGLKERTLGLEVFGRPADYDTGADPIVRVTVAEIRKRIAQYYHEEAHAGELRIELTPGSYIPEFLPPRESAPEPSAAPEPPAGPEPLTAAEPETPAVPPPLEPANDLPAPAAFSVARRGVWAAATAAGVLLLCAALVLLRPALRLTAMDRLWAPVFADAGPVTFCLPISLHRNSIGSAGTTGQAIAHALDLSGTASSAPGETFFDHENLGENVVYSDVVAMAKLESVVEQQHRPVHVRLNVGTNLNDFRDGPSIFIGGLDNQWTLKLLEGLRYRFAGNDVDRYYIRDANDPQNQQWSVRLKDKMTVVNRDYALIARVHSGSLERVVVVAAGIGMSGTAAAGEFLADPVQVKELERRIGYRNRNRDFEAVLATDVDDGIAGAARIVALDVR